MMTQTQTTETFIRQATSDDRAAIERLLTDAQLPTEGVAEILADHPDDFFVAEVNDATRRIVGAGGLEACCDDALLRSVVVQPEWRSHGVGHDLVRRIVCHAESRGMRALYLLTLTAEHYFPRFGFERIERGSVPRDIAETVEFKSVCPDTAAVMMKAIA
jgi:amino-acid N-acetyltransferase